MKGESISENDQDVNKKFEVAVQLVKSLPQSASFSPSYAEATKIYSYFKQSKFGPCSIPRPGFWDVVNRAKWDAWSALGDMPSQVAMKSYVEEIKKVYQRIKDIDAFEERHVEFADVLIPFCQITGTPMTSKLMEIVKHTQHKDQPIQVNGNGANGVNGVHESGNDDSDNNEENAANTNGIDEVPPCNGDVMDSVDIGKVSKSVKFQISDEKGRMSNDSADTECQISCEENMNGNIEKHNTESKSEVNNVIKNDAYEKEEGELSSSENDSDEEEVYCDSLDPDQIQVVTTNDKEPDLVESISIIALEPITTEEPVKEVLTEPLLFSPIPSTTTFQDTTAQNILSKSAEHSRSSSNNSRSDFELVDVSEKKTFQSVRKRDVPPTLADTNEIGKPIDKKLSNMNTVSVKSDSFEKCFSSELPCHACKRNHKKSSHSYIRQSHSGHRSDNGGRNSRNTDNGNYTSHNNHSNGYRNHHHHHHHDTNHNRRSTSEGSNNGGSDDDSCSSLSSSSSDNVGLKIIKALERMDDNMQLILKRLDSIDSSMKILAVQPPPPWWVQYIPSKWVILSTLWPFVVNLIFFYLWRRKRRRIRKKLAAVPTSLDFT